MAESKKNVIPLVLGVTLALAAVYTVHKMLAEKKAADSIDNVDVIVAAKNLSSGELINEGAYTRKDVARTAAPSKAIPYNQHGVIMNQKMCRDVTMGDYITYDDISVGDGLSDLVGEGEWAIPISLEGGAITNRLRPGDEIAIMGTFSVTERKKSPVVGQGMVESTRKVTLVILPQVRILALNGNHEQGGDQFVLALPPKQAQVLVAAQEQGIPLAPALRKPHDENHLDRTTTGLVDMETFNNLVQGVERTVIPTVPSKK